MILLLVGCDAFGGAAVGVDLLAYAGLDDDATWTWRDDGDTGIPDAEQLIHGQNDGKGNVELRRGVQWGAAEPVGALEFDVSDGLALASWSWDDDGSDSLVPFGKKGMVEGDITYDGDWRCVLRLPDGIDTFYAHYADVAEFECSGGSLPGTFDFAKDVGLVLMRTKVVDLSLVAPY